MEKMDSLLPWNDAKIKTFTCYDVKIYLGKHQELDSKNKKNS